MSSRFFLAVLFATKPIKRGVYIVTYRGRRITTEEADRREARGAKYQFEINKRWTIDGSPRWNVSALFRSDQHARLNPKHRHRNEIFQRIVWKMRMQDPSGPERGRAGDERVTVGVRFSDVREPDNAAGAWLGLDHHWLADELRHAVEHNAGRGVGSASGRKWTDDPDWSRGPVIGLGGGCGK
jgi:hypothetical protein